VTAVLIGLDLGTSSTKTVAMSADGQVLARASREYPIRTPRAGWAEQDPQWWWQAAVEAIQQVLREGLIDPSVVRGISFSGQMHGTVLLGEDLAPLRPAIIWADQRSAAQVDQAKAKVGLERMLEWTANSLYPGFMGATLAWMAQEEPETLKRTRWAVLPKDYVRLRLTGEVATDVSDASATAVYDTVNRRWSGEMLKALGIPEGLMPKVLESEYVAGAVTKKAAEATGLPAGIPVVAGGGDQPVAALGNGVVEPGMLLVTIGTGGQLFAAMESPLVDSRARVHTFCHCVPKRWHLLGATLCAGLSLRWLRNNLRAVAPGIDYEQMSELAAQAPPGSEGLLFCPYLIGERTPHLDPDAQGAFVGLTLRHALPHLVRAIMEGVAFSLRDALEVFRLLGLEPQRAIVSGGGGRSRVWRQILADVLGMELVRAEGEEQAAIGAAMLAGMGTGVYVSPAEACSRVVRLGDRVEPSPGAELYTERYRQFLKCYPALKAPRA